ncbi:hypothetical protein [Aeromonas salmonicida]|uniref:hypothetical protein n=1 Tax=Aeromonas salmonicida TaxID=645 RepID=UPI0030CC910B
MAKPKQFVTEVEAEKLAKKHLEAFVNECHCQSNTDVMMAIQKMMGVSLCAHQLVQTGRSVTVQ